MAKLGLLNYFGPGNPGSFILPNLVQHRFILSKKTRTKRIVSDCGLITILSQLNRQKIRQSFRSFITIQIWFSSTRMSLLFQFF